MRPPNRRLFLRNAAATLALPLLPSALTREARADTEAPRRMIYWYVPNGIPFDVYTDAQQPILVSPNNWTPTVAGPSWWLAGLPYLLEPLGDLVTKVAVISGLDNNPLGRSVDGGDHAVGTGSYLTCAEILSSSGADIENSMSVDQVAAAATPSSTPFPSLQLGMEEGGSTGECNAGFSCAYMRNLAWAANSTPLPNIIDPAVAFQLLFPSSNLSPEEAARKSALRGSVLDYVLEEANQLDGRLGSADQVKLDQYLTAVREVETRIAELGVGGCGRGVGEVSLDITLAADILSDLQVLALQCDMTRIVTFMLANSQSNRSYNFLGVTGAHHELSHHQRAAAPLADLQEISRWEVERFAYLLRSLDAVTDVNGATLLDNAAVYFSSEVQDGDTHSHTNLPVLVAGGMGGKLAVGQHLDFRESPRRMSDLFLAFLEAYGTPVASFGDATGPLDEILA